MKVKVIWLFPPADQGFPNVSQYRFYKKMPVRVSIIYPYLASSGCTQLLRAGHEVKFMDCPTMELSWKDVEREILDADLVVMEGRTPVIQDLWRAIERLTIMKPDLKIAVYGDHVSWNPTETLEKGADFIIQGGDFDYSIKWLCDVLRIGERNPRGVINTGLVECLDKLPWVDRELVPWKLYYETWRKRETFMWNMGMRGCYFKCVYCAWAGTLWNNKLRYRHPQDVADETLRLYQKYGELEILDDSDLFELYPWGVKFANALMDYGLQDGEVLWSCQTHPSQVVTAQDHIWLLKKSGLRVVKLGIESGNDRSLLFMKKGSTRKMAEKAVGLLQENDVMVHANTMIGFPWENKQEVLEWLKWIKKLDPNQAQFSLLIPYPNTELWEWAEREDWFIQDKLDWSLYNAEFPMLKMNGLTGEEIVDLYRKAWSSFYLDPKYIWRHLKTVRHWEGFKHLLRGFYSVRFGHMRAVRKGRRK